MEPDQEAVPPPAEDAGHRQTIRAVLDAVTESITVQAPDGRLVLANEAAAAALGFPSVSALLRAGPEALASRFEILDEADRPFPRERLPERAALRGEEPEDVLVRLRSTVDGTERVTRVRARPVRDDTGAVVFAVNVLRDVTDRQRALAALRASEARLAFLATASRRLLTTSLEPHRVLEAVTELVIPELADWSVVREVAHHGQQARMAAGPRHLQQEEPLLSLGLYHDAPPEHPRPPA